MATEFGKRLRQARLYAKMTQVEVSQATGISQSTISTAERESYGSLDTPKYAHLYKVNSNWLATGEGEMLDPESHKAAEAAPAGYDASSSLHVPLLANAGSMGGGVDELHEDVIIGTLALSPAWVRQHVRPTSPSSLRFIHGYGESMAPTFTDGDVLLVDTEARDPGSIDGVYVLRANARLYIKRVRRRLDGLLEVSSDNPTIKTVDVLKGDEEVCVVGRVIWVWNGKKL